MTKILSPLSSQLVVCEETRTLVGDVREDFFIGATDEKNISRAYDVRSDAVQHIFVEVREGVACDMKFFFHVHERHTKLGVRISFLLQRNAEISFDVSSFVEAVGAQSDVRVFVVFNEGAKATVRAFTRASEKGAVVHEEICGLALGEAASASFLPELSLLHDDTVAVHATSMTHLNERRVGYFLSRGVSRHDAVRCLVDAFLYGNLS